LQQAGINQINQSIQSIRRGNWKMNEQKQKREPTMARIFITLLIMTFFSFMIFFVCLGWVG
jgi:hypothetical protein